MLTGMWIIFIMKLANYLIKGSPEIGCQIHSYSHKESLPPLLVFFLEDFFFISELGKLSQYCSRQKTRREVNIYALEMK